MKQIILLIIISFTAYSQNVLNPSSLLQNFGGLDQRLTNNDEFYPLGWNWENEARKMDSAMLINSNHYSMGQWDISENPHKFKTNLNFIPQIQPVVHADRTYSLTQAQAIQYEPFLNCNTCTFTPIENDETGAVFGFSNISSLLFSGGRIC